DDDLVAAMDRVRQVCSTASALRKSAGLRVRLPLARLTVVTSDADRLRPLAGLIADELNVRRVDLTEPADVDAGAFGVRRELRVDARAAGPRLGRELQTAIRAATAGHWSVDDQGRVVAGGVRLLPDEYLIETVAGHAAAGDHQAVALLPGGPRGGAGGGAAGFVVLDTAVTPD